jgi:hypothetical protein
MRDIDNPKTLRWISFGSRLKCSFSCNPSRRPDLGQSGNQCLNHAGNRSDLSAVVLFGFGQRFAISYSSTPDGPPRQAGHLSENRRFRRTTTWQRKCAPLSVRRSAFGDSIGIPCSRYSSWVASTAQVARILPHSNPHTGLWHRHHHRYLFHR